MISEVLLAENV